MATKNFSDYNVDAVPHAENMRFGIVVSEWNIEITSALASGAVNTLLKHGATDDNIQIKYVPGSFELPLGAQFFAEFENVDAVIMLGCVIQGETRHFDFICDAVTLDRAGGKLGNKGDEAAITAIKMVNLKNNF
ncbi:MAG: 6,7-dimethyl-8-ribityllumazine synthase [Draconibacterium sp.]|nr:MAG: 6,7-dimethyl-8-ribityllumazine synthase [Draconibacterium sp.]